MPLINPPGTALEFLEVVGLGENKPYKALARKIAINTTLFLAVVMVAGPSGLRPSAPFAVLDAVTMFGPKTDTS